jgi:hypothetical protein
MNFISVDLPEPGFPVIQYRLDELSSHSAKESHALSEFLGRAEYPQKSLCVCKRDALLSIRNFREMKVL